MKMQMIVLMTLLSSFTLASAPAEQPNILVIVSDDHGFADVGFHGCKDIHCAARRETSSRGECECRSWFLGLQSFR